jgi:N-acetylneuraminic acid mutarotase
VVPAALAIALLVVVSTRGSESKTRFERASDYWVYAARMPHRRSYTASAKLGGKVYVAAGMVGETGRPLDVFERFDPRRNSWTSLPPVPEKFSAAAAADFAGRVWVVGGNVERVDDLHGGNPGRADGRQVYSYDVRRGRWRAQPNLPAPRTNLAVVALHGKLYAIGGLDPFYATNTVFVYEPRTRRWSDVAPLPKPVQAHAAVAFRGELWVLGGRNRSGKVLRDVWIYNDRQNRWRPGQPLPKPMETLGADVAGDRIDVVLESDYFIYDARTSRWRRGPSQNVPRHALGVYTVGGFLYSLGGCIVPQLQDSSVVEKIALAPRTTS